MATQTKKVIKDMEVTVDTSSDFYMHIDGLGIEEYIFEHELVDYKYTYRTDEIDLLEGLLKTQQNDLDLIKEDIKLLKKMKEEWVYSNVGTNEYICESKHKKQFQEITKSILEAQMALTYCRERNLPTLPTSQNQLNFILSLMTNVPKKAKKVMFKPKI